MRIVNEGEYNYVQRCNLKGRARTCESHVVTNRKHRVRSPPTRLNRRLKFRRDRRHRHQGLLTPQQLASKCKTLRQEHNDKNNSKLYNVDKTWIDDSSKKIRLVTGMTLMVSIN